MIRAEGAGRGISTVRTNSGLVAVLDLGTSAIKAAAVGPDGIIAAIESCPAPPLTPDAGTFDAARYARLALSLLRRVALGCFGSVSALSVSSQRATVLALDRDLAPLAPACSWMSARCAREASTFYEALGPGRFRDITGLLPSPIYAVAKMAAGELPGADDGVRYVDLQAWLLLCLGATEPVIDPSNASALGLATLERAEWSRELCGPLDLSPDALPRIAPAGSVVGGLSAEAAQETGLDPGTPLVLGGGDQQCAVLGSGSLEVGEIALSLGTAAAMAGPATQAPAPPPAGLLAGHHVVPGQWLVEGFVPTFGAAAAWAAAALGLPDVSSLAQRAADVADSGGVAFAPSLAGSGSPDFDGAARGAWLGMTVSTGPSQLARATLEGLACEVGRIARCFEEVGPLARLRVVGGGSRSDLQLRLIADTLGVELALCDRSEAALLGAAALAWVGAGRYGDAVAAATAVGAQRAAMLAPCADPERAARRARHDAAVRAVGRFGQEGGGP
jgi:xylulokinase